MIFNRNRHGNKPPSNNPGLIKSVFIAHFILLLHAVLVVGLGGAVFFFGGIVHYMPWILTGGAALILFSGYRFYRKLKNDKKSLTEFLSDPLLMGKEVEVSFLGGFISVRMDGRAASERLAIPQAARQLEDPEALRLRELRELARLFEKNLITAAEFQKAKQGIFKS